MITEGKNGDFRQETEEFERALAEVSRNEKLSAAAGEAAYMSETDEGDELTKQIAGTCYLRTIRTIDGAGKRFPLCCVFITGCVPCLISTQSSPLLGDNLASMAYCTLE